MALQLGSGLRKQSLQDNAGGSFMDPIVGWRVFPTEGFLQEQPANSSHTAKFGNGCGCPRPALDHLCEQRQPHRVDLAAARQALDRHGEKLYLVWLQVTRRIGESIVGSAKTW